MIIIDDAIFQVLIFLSGRNILYKSGMTVGDSRKSFLSTGERNEKRNERTEVWSR